MRRAIVFVVLGCLSAALSASAGAAVLYQQVTLEGSERGAFSDSCQQIADGFVPVASGDLTSVTWQGSYYYTDNPNATESFTIRVYADSAGVPAASHLFEQTALATKAANGTLLGRTLYDYSMAIAGGPSLAAGTTYWIAINTNEPCNNYAWAPSADGPSPPLSAYWSGASWSQQGGQRGNLVFTLHGDVVVVAAPPALPVPLLAPGALALLGLLVAGIAAHRLHAR